MLKKQTYTYYKQIFEGQKKPFAYVDLDYFDQNIKDILVRAQDKKVRLASKSIRSVGLMQRILEYSGQYQGIMCFTAEEAVWLAELGFDDLLVAYPTVNTKLIEQVGEVLKKGTKIYLMTDSLEHLHKINQIGAQLKVAFPICMDLDMSSTFPGIYFGVYRSSLTSIKAVERYLDSLSNFPFVNLRGIMGYEAQIAGVGNQVEGQGVKNKVIKILQKRSWKEISARRAKVVDMTEAVVGTLDFVNGGGTGSVEMTRNAAGVTEITVGSGFYAPTLFDAYEQFQHFPAAGYAVEIVRQPQQHIYTCMGGGYVASGPLDINKLPQPYLPQGCELFANEMAGEVQTPIQYKGKELLELGDPVFFRHSKAGELCERFEHLILVANGKIVEKITTYRGDGKCFL